MNWGTCCSGVNSTYEIRMGRSTSPTGPVPRSQRRELAQRRWYAVLRRRWRQNRPRPIRTCLPTAAGQDKFTYHYYDGGSNGAPTFGINNLYWTADDWPSVAAVNPDWTGAGSANWSATGNWSSTQVPTASGAVANFPTNSAGRYTVNLDAPQTVSRINFRSATPYTIGANGDNTLHFSKMTGDAAATINVSTGSDTIAAPITSTDDLQINVTPQTSTLTLSGGVSGGNLNKYGAGILTLSGANTFTGHVYTQNGSLQITGPTSVTGILTAGLVGGDVGAITVSGSGSVTAANDLNIGDTGDSATPATGTLTIKDNASVTVGTGGAFVVGSGFFNNTQATGTVQQSGGTLTANGNFDGAFIIGGRTSSLPTGTYNLFGGTVNANTNVRVGGNGTGIVNQTGGTFTSNSYVSIGRFAARMALTISLAAN